jgi:hypothetical protein
MERDLLAGALRCKLGIVVTIQAGFVVGVLSKNRWRAQKKAEHPNHKDRDPQAQTYTL